MNTPLRVTLDTNQLDQVQVDRLGELLPSPHELAIVSVSARERDETAELRTITETAVWGESRWGEAVWGGDPVGEPFVIGESPLGVGVVVDDAHADILESALSVISNGSFPPPGNRDDLSDGQRRQLRDAMIFEAHARAGRHVFVTNDRKGFINDGRRETLQALGRTRIVTPLEVEQLALSGSIDDLRP